jgi:hypothetical protein
VEQLIRSGRTSLRPETELSIFSEPRQKKWLNLNYSYALHFFHYDFIRVHSTLRMTRAMETMITDHILTWEELLKAL